MKKGFTLLELSIVLVIIGLIVGGVLVGQTLISTAAIRSTISQYESYKTAVLTFQTKYNAIPGDLTEQLAAELSFAPTTRNYTNYNTIHGNGVIDGNLSADSTGTFVWQSESFLFWQDLSSANMVAGTYQSATDTTFSSSSSAEIGRYFPESKLGKRLLWSVINGYNYCGPGNGVNCYMMANITDINGGNWGYSPDITPTEAYSLDSKVDDGLPISGIVYGGNNSNCYTIIAPGNVIYSTNTAPHELVCDQMFKF